MPREYRARARAELMTRTRDRIVAAALELVPDAVDVPVDAIAAAAGVSVQTLYSHFGSKRGLLLAVIDSVQRDEGLYADIERVWASPDGETALRRMIEATFSIWHRGWRLIQFAERMRRTDPEIRRVLREVDSYRLGDLRAITDRLAVEGRLRAELDAGAAAELVFALSTPSVYDELVVAYEWAPDRATAATTESIVSGVIDRGTLSALDAPPDWSNVRRPSEILAARIPDGSAE